MSFTRKLHLYLQFLPTAHVTAGAPPPVNQQQHNKCNALESSRNHPHHHRSSSLENCLLQNQSLMQKGWQHWFKPPNVWGTLLWQL